MTLRLSINYDQQASLDAGAQPLRATDLSKANQLSDDPSTLPTDMTKSSIIDPRLNLTVRTDSVIDASMNAKDQHDTNEIKNILDFKPISDQNQGKRTFSSYENLGFELPGPAPTQFTTSWRRWPLLFLYVNCCLCIGSISLCFSPASKEIA